MLEVPTCNKTLNTLLLIAQKTVYNINIMKQETWRRKHGKSMMGHRISVFSTLGKAPSAVLQHQPSESGTVTMELMAINLHIS